MIFHQSGAPSLSFIRQTLNTFYYSTGFPCTYIPCKGDSIQYSLQIGVPEAYSEDMLKPFVAESLPDTDDCALLTKGSLVVLTVSVVNKGRIHGLILSDISGSKPLQHESLKHLLNLCLQSSTQPPRKPSIVPDNLNLPSIEVNKVKHHPYFLERRQVHELLLTGQSSVNIDNEYVLPQLADNPLRSTKNHRIISQAIYARAAIDLGLDVHTSFSLSDHYIPAIEACKSIQEVDRLSAESIEIYHRYVHGRKNSQPPIVESMKDFIDAHLYETVALKNFAETVDYSYSYLSALFKEHTGMTFSAYTRSKKTELACTLLKSTDRSVHDISESLGFTYPYQFINAFKKVMGVTPGGYRKVILSQSPAASEPFQ